jgi:hypothetical protein
VVILSVSSSAQFVSGRPDGQIMLALKAMGRLDDLVALISSAETISASQRRLS